MLLGMLLACGAHAGPELPRATVPDGFWEHWGDGRAELDSYRLVQPRYGGARATPRDGTALLIFVTEDFTEAQRVKSDGSHGDEYPVLKLNDIRHFQTGIYDYEVMASTFVRLDGAWPVGRPVKTSLSVQEWCGHVYEQLLPRDGALQWTGHSYFDGEGDHDERLPLPADGVLGEALPIVARGLTGDWPAPGTEVTVPYLPTLLASRFAHRDPAWGRATIRRGAEPQRVEVPAGAFDAVEVTVAVEGGPTVRYLVEAAAPHRIVRWASSDGEEAELVASERLAYWKLNHEGDEARLRELGLAELPLPVAPASPEPATP
ncbi:MAG: hypothetical protein R3F59_16810 [Myxococcota bacterium]